MEGPESNGLSVLILVPEEDGGKDGACLVELGELKEVRETVGGQLGDDGNGEEREGVNEGLGGLEGKEFGVVGLRAFVKKKGFPI